MAVKPVETRRLYLQIADKLRALIGQPDFARNGKLPPERVLAERLGVSRPSVREALVALELEGRVEIRMGSGVYVCATPDTAAGAVAPEAELGDSLLDIMAARAVIEGAIAASVAPFCEPKALKALRGIYDTMAHEVEAGQIPIAAGNTHYMIVLDAFELQGELRAGYEFRIIGNPEDDVLTLLGRLVEKMRRALSVKDHATDGHQLRISEQTVRGRIAWDGSGPENMPLVVVDGKEISWDDFGRC